ncbi:hypothetical protein FACS1894202_05960 [Clostridia bacterium]|nr:hypothetical protein FACS1894202_05960 [Clostridia bacterium]
MTSCIARQPILDRNLQIYAYELLFRSNNKDNFFQGVDADQASSRTIMEGFQTMGIDKLTDRHPAFINFTQNLLVGNFATLFPKEYLVVEVLEDVDPTPEVVAACRSLVEQGYTLALDDFVYRPELEPLIEIASIIKFDFLISSPTEVSEMLTQMNVTGKLLLAEKIETMEMFELAASMGFVLFQGYFFSRPVTFSAKEISPLAVNHMLLLKEINSGQAVDFAKLSKIIRNDVALSYKLLKLINSSYFGLSFSITDVQHAVTALGLKEVRKWISLLGMAGLSDDKPDELIRMSMIRGRFMEQLKPYCKKIKVSAESLFMTGLFSLVDVLMDQPMKQALSGMSLDKEITDVLVNHKGSMAGLLLMAISIEQGKWGLLDKLCATHEMDVDVVSEQYLFAMQECDAMHI